MKAFSAPGKAFLAGGYLVLDPQYPAYVVALSARIHAVIEKCERSDQLTIITARSPQFKDGEWTYTCTIEGRNAYVPTCTTSKNPFIESVVRTVLAYVRPDHNASISITIYSDDAYHSQQRSIKSGKRFNIHEKAINDVPKTGMGSSAALTTALTAALLSCYKPELTNNLNIIHNLAQLAHCTAQKKIGSGFDIASAVFGSVIYRRFPEETLADLTDTEVILSQNYPFKVRQVIDSSWKVQLDPCSIPPGLSVLMGDVYGGSETPKLVTTVHEWRKRCPERALEIYSDLNNANIGLMSRLNELHECVQQQRDHQIKEDDQLVVQMKIDFKQIRRNLKLLTTESGAPIEPSSQTKLLDLCSTLPGVIGGVVPGAGGYDAICLVVLSSAVDQIKKITNQRVDEFGDLTWLDLSEQKVGLVEETDFSIYQL